MLNPSEKGGFEGVEGVCLACMPECLRAGSDKHESWRKNGECATRGGKSGGIAADRQQLN